jgi:predicted esterase
MPICLIHGEDDIVVPVALSKITHKYLVENGYDCQFHKIPALEHSISDKGIKIAKQFLKNL